MMSLMAVETRPDPDELLAHVKAEEARARRGKLRIFFGATAGVGKTFSMLEARAQARARAASTSSSATSSRTAASRPSGCSKASSSCRRCRSRYRGMVRHEFDLDAALKRRPAILLVDELAHSNLIGGDPPPRHAKRWQDIEELLERASTSGRRVNVQHLESLNDLVAQITGVQAARDDARPHLRRGRRGRADRPAARRPARAAARPARSTCRTQVGTAVERFFRKPNLIALRELALRRMTDRVEAAARASLAGDRTLARVARAGSLARRRSGPTRRPSSSCAPANGSPTRCDAQWTVVYVETPELLRLSEKERNRRIDLLRLAESLGAETVTLDGPTAAQALARVRADAQRDAHRRRRAEAARLARAAAPLDGDRAVRSARRASTSSRSRADGRAGAARAAPLAAPAEYAQRRSLETLRSRRSRSTARLHGRCVRHVSVLRARRIS